MSERYSYIRYLYRYSYIVKLGFSQDESVMSGHGGTCLYSPATQEAESGA